MRNELEQLEEAGERGNVPRPNGNQHCVMMEFEMPKWSHVRKFTMRELHAPDQLRARMLADQKRNSAMEDSIYGLLSLEQFESMRLAFMEVDGMIVNQAIEYQGLDTWSLKMIRFAQQAYNDLNGVEEDELANFTKSAKVVSGPSAKSSSESDSTPAIGT